ERPGMVGPVPRVLRLLPESLWENREQAAGSRFRGRVVKGDVAQENPTAGGDAGGDTIRPRRDAPEPVANGRSPARGSRPAGDLTGARDDASPHQMPPGDASPSASATGDSGGIPLHSRLQAMLQAARYHGVELDVNEFRHAPGEAVPSAAALSLWAQNA